MSSHGPPASAERSRWGLVCIGGPHLASEPRTEELRLRPRLPASRRAGPCLGQVDASRLLVVVDQEPGKRPSAWAGGGAPPRLWGLDPSTGEVLWSWSLDPDDSWWSVERCFDRVVLTSDRAVHLLERRGPRRVLGRALGHSIPARFGPDGTGYAVSLDGSLLSFDELGTERWRIPPDHEPFGAPFPLDDGSGVCVSSSTGLWRVQADGRCLWHVHTSRNRVEAYVRPDGLLVRAWRRTHRASLVRVRVDRPEQSQVVGDLVPHDTGILDFPVLLLGCEGDEAWLLQRDGGLAPLRLCRSWRGRFGPLPEGMAGVLHDRSRHRLVGVDQSGQARWSARSARGWIASGERRVVSICDETLRRWSW